MNVCVCVLGLLPSVSSILSLNTTLSHINGNQAQRWRAEDLSRPQPLKLNGAFQGVR